jgi:hypothetical protein
MSTAIEDDQCFLCGQPSRSATYNRGNGKVFIDCTNSDCGEYLITNAAMKSLFSNEKKRQTISRSATSRAQIKIEKKILTISYHGGIKEEMKQLEEALSKEEIGFFGF